MSKLVSLDYLDDYNIESLRNAVQLAFSRLDITQIKPKMKVMIKVCLPEPVSKDMAETTNPAVVRAVVDYITKMGASCVVVESPKGKFTVNHLNDVYLNSGMLEMANLTICELNRDLSTSEIETPNGVMAKSITTLDIVNKVDAIINIGKLKLDETLGFMGATSNIFGLIPGDMKTLILNRMENLSDYNNYVVDMMESLKHKVVLNVVDAVVALEANKTQRMLNCLAVSECPYALDAALLDILGIKYEHTILKQAAERGIFDLEKPYKLIGDKIERFTLDDFALVDFDNNKIIKTSKSYFKTHQQRPNIDKNKCKGCKICSKICPTNAILMKYDSRGELYAEIDYKKCIYCNKCITACPYNVVNQVTPLKHKKMEKQLNKYNEQKG
ncbi:MAG: DUF362 domain-containing protein [Clostridia bacterium]|nr:DUF362 domain-containing protein [Clostridia bacterium]